METFLIFAAVLGFVVLVNSAVGAGRNRTTADAPETSRNYDITTLILILILGGVLYYLSQQTPQ